MSAAAWCDDCGGRIKSGAWVFSTDSAYGWFTSCLACHRKRRHPICWRCRSRNHPADVTCFATGGIIPKGKPLVLSEGVCVIPVSWFIR